MSFWQDLKDKIPGWCIGLLAGVLFLIAGACRGQYADIYRKAVRICLECIGIG